MNLMKKITGVVLAAAMVTLSGVPAFAAGGYTETALTLPSGVTDDAKILGLYAHSDGSLDCFTSVTIGERGKAKEYTYSHDYSTDGGKTWSKKPMEWAADSVITSIYADNQGIVYCVIGSEGYEVIKDNDTHRFPAYSVLKVTNGVAKKIPGLTLKGEQISRYQIAGIAENGNLVLCGTGRSGTKGSPAYFTIDLTTGTVHQQNVSFIPEIYRNGKIYGSDWNKERTAVDFVGVDAGTGKESTRISVSSGQGLVWGMTAGQDGATYRITEQGLFRLKSNDTDFEKLLDGSACKLGAKEMAVSGGTSITCDANGNVYVIVQRLDEKTGVISDRTLYRYSPVK